MQASAGLGSARSSVPAVLPLMVPSPIRRGFRCLHGLDTCSLSDQHSTHTSGRWQAPSLTNPMNCDCQNVVLMRSCARVHVDLISRPTSSEQMDRVLHRDRALCMRLTNETLHFAGVQSGFQLSVASALMPIEVHPDELPSANHQAVRSFRPYEEARVPNPRRASRNGVTRGSVALARDVYSDMCSHACAPPRSNQAIRFGLCNSGQCQACSVNAK
ncbi:hypothetical protein IE81DRAFT_78923 [Ceraceosorus guamensis]|uniref:Uncharacterized protein n=1 Tax=Ceraceosorus guamensis TaxID=1522189 RepID=A0A316VNU8_9BASI|nr:hypothetical protein IE81DRAFT_78923 [Ceraceosorus guamensis]PWN38738.1 hypothetical protein IE81DRAFT_78923 [Ceraceosorus guamensis]